MVDDKKVYEYIKHYWKPERLNQLISASGASQNQIAEKTGIEINSLRNYCKGKTVPGIEVLVTLADYFIVPVDYIIGRSNEKDHEEMMSKYEQNFQSLRKSAYEDYLFKYNSATAVPSFENKYESVWPYNLYETIFGEAPKDPITEEQVTLLEEILATLPDRENEVIRLRFGADKSRRLTLDETGKLFNVNRETIRSIETRAINKLRQPSMKKWGIQASAPVVEEYTLQLRISGLKKRTQELLGDILHLEYEKEEMECVLMKYNDHANKLGINVEKEKKELSESDFDQIDAFFQHR